MESDNLWAFEISLTPSASYTLFPTSNARDQLVMWLLDPPDSSQASFLPCRVSALTKEQGLIQNGTGIIRKVAYNHVSHYFYIL